MTAEEGKDVTIPRLQVRRSEVERGVRIVPKRVGPGLKKHQIGRRGLEEPGQVLLKDFEKMRTVGVGRKSHGKMIGAIGMFLLGHIPKTDVIPVVVAVDGELADPGAILDELGSAVPVMKIEVEHGSRAKGAGAVEFFQGDHQAVERAETFAVIGARMMKTTGDGGGDAVGKGRGGGRMDGAAGEADGFVKTRHPGKLLGLGQRAGFSGFNRADVVVGVNAEQIGAGDRFLAQQADAFEFGHAVGDELKLFHRHSVFADGGGLTGMVKGFDHVRVGGINGTGEGPSG